MKPSVDYEIVLPEQATSPAAQVEHPDTVTLDYDSLTPNPDTMKKMSLALEQMKLLRRSLEQAQIREASMHTRNRVRAKNRSRNKIAKASRKRNR